MVIEKLSRNFFMYLSKNKALNNSAKKWGLKLGAKQVVAGVTIENAIEAVQELNAQGLVATVDHLGEFILSEEEAKQATEYCIKTLDAIYESKVDCNLSLKLTQLGLDIDPKLCEENMIKIVTRANEYDIFVRIDMEDSSRCQATLDLLSNLRKEFTNVGTVIQAYLHRAEADVKDLKGVPLRLVKGAYKEPASIAYQDRMQIDANYMKIIKEHLLSGSYTAIASHDHEIIRQVKEFCKEQNIPKSQFEFQMLYGMRTELQKEIANEGYTMRIYVPYGDDWYGYFMRRLAERPQNVAFALRGFFSK